MGIIGLNMKVVSFRLMLDYDNRLALIAMVSLHYGSISIEKIFKLKEFRIDINRNV